MNSSNQSITYALLVIPLLFALAVMGQGVYKVIKKEKDGGLVSGFGIVFLIAIVAAWWFFIR
jgi:hypothetical protein